MDADPHLARPGLNLGQVEDFEHLRLAMREKAHCAHRFILHASRAVPTAGCAEPRPYRRRVEMPAGKKRPSATMAVPRGG
jgi:hypothetical protein